MKELWYKNAIIYGLDVKTFQDSDGDGWGDFMGLISRLDYLRDLGITCIWLLPFFPSPNRDNGYDVSDYYNVDPRLGTLDDFRNFVYEAKKRGLRVIIDLVVQHTSDEHPWFKAAQAQESSPFHKFYIWANKPVVIPTAHTSFLGEEKRQVWTYSKNAKRWYHHWFYHFQPDLDVANPEVQEEIFRIVRFWMSFGISGFRVDAAGLFFERLGIPEYKTKNPGPFLRKLRNVVLTCDPDGVLLGEADVRLHKLRYYFGDGHRIHMLLNFMLNEYIVYSIAKESALPIKSIMRKLPKAPDQCSWVNFIRNLDELNLERLGKEAMEEIKKELKVTRDMWIYHRGIRRRIAPILENSMRLRMVWSLVFSLPGSFFLAYGDEIGMGDDLALPFRLSVRTPMQWNSGPSGGFSKAPGKELILPVIDKGKYGFSRVNVARQKKDPKSIYNFINNLIQLRKKFTEIGYGRWKIISRLPKKILGILYEYNNHTLMVFHNLSRESVSFDLPDFGTFKTIFKFSAFKRGYKVQLDPYGELWLRK